MYNFDSCHLVIIIIIIIIMWLNERSDSNNVDMAKLT